MLNLSYNTSDVVLGFFNSDIFLLLKWTKNVSDQIYW